jgi:hypothetical protein
MRLIRFVFVAAIALAAAPVWPQTTTGRLMGTTVDASGAALAGVDVTISSPVLIGGAQARITDDRGEFLFLLLAPGDYTLTAERDGFLTQERNLVTVPLGRAAVLTIEMPEGRFSGEIEVVNETPIVDPTQVGAGQVFREDYLQGSAIGSENRAYYSIVAQTPGVHLTRVSGLAVTRVYGSTYGQNAYFIDGVDTSNVVGYWGYSLNFDAIREIAIGTGGYEAEFGRATGGIINVVTRSGGNLFSGAVDARYRDASFQESGDFYDPSVLETRYRSIGATLGGPLLRDRMWFFASYQGSIYEETPFASPATLSNEDQNSLAKLTWAISRPWLVSGKYNGWRLQLDDYYASQFVSAEATGLNNGDTESLSAQVSGVLSESLLLNLAAGTTRWSWHTRPMSGDLETIAHHNFETGMWTENFNFHSRDNDRRDDLAADLTWFVRGLGGSHEIKAGVELSETSLEVAGCLTGTTSTEFCAPGSRGYLFSDHGTDVSRPYLMSEQEAAGFGSYDGAIRTGFAQDAWRVSRDLTLKLGLRYDAATYRNNEGTEVADMAELQPRVGAAWDLTGDAENVLRGSWGRFFLPDSLRLPMFASTLSQPEFLWYSCTTLMGAASAAECAALAVDLGWDYRTDPENWDPYGWVLAPGGSPTEPGVIDPSLRATYADELILAFERAVGRRSSVELTYVDKKTRDVFDDTCNGNVPMPSVDAACDYWILANFPDLLRDYEAFIVKYETRGLNWLTLLASYTYSTSKGSVEADFAGAEYDYYPWNFDNLYGFLGDHRRHRLRLNGFLTFRGDWNVAFDGSWSSSFTWTPTEFPPEPLDFDHNWHFLEPRGSREASNQYQLDLQLSKGFTTGRVRFVLIGSVYNVFSSEQPTAVCRWNSGCDGYEMGEPTEWQLPRRYEVGFRVEF